MVQINKLILMAEETAILKAQIEVTDVFERQLEEVRQKIAELEHESELPKGE